MNVYSKNTITEAIRLYKDGVSAVEIQHKLNIKEGALYWWFRKLGVPKKIKVYPKYIINEAKKLYESGAGPTEIESKLGLPSYSQQYWFGKMGVKMRTEKEAQRLRHERGFCVTPTYDKAYSWKGGRIKTREGYIRVKLPMNDFFLSMSNSRQYICEHRLVMAKHLRRCLLPWEVVHHKNGIKDDNRIENLELLPAAYKHIAMTHMQGYIKKQDQKISKLEMEMEDQKKQIKLLQWQLKEMRLEREGYHA